MTNKKLGNDFERDFCMLMQDRDYWVLNIPQTQSGQPADVIAVKEGKAVLIDCKICTGKTFALSRVEPNQKTAMSYWEALGNGTGWFAIKINRNIYMISLRTLEALERAGNASLTETQINQYGYKFEWWEADRK